MMTSKNITIAVAILVVVAGLYWYMSGSSSGSQLPVMATAPGANPAQTQFLQLAGELQPVSFDTKIFSDPRFASLVNLSTPVTPETSGRQDPFAPIPGVSATSGTGQ